MEHSNPISLENPMSTPSTPPQANAKPILINSYKPLNEHHMSPSLSDWLQKKNIETRQEREVRTMLSGQLCSMQEKNIKLQSELEMLKSSKANHEDELKRANDHLNETQDTVKHQVILLEERKREVQRLTEVVGRNHICAMRQLKQFLERGFKHQIHAAVSAWRIASQCAFSTQTIQKQTGLRYLEGVLHRMAQQDALNSLEVWLAGTLLARQEWEEKRTQILEARRAKEEAKYDDQINDVVAVERDQALEAQLRMAVAIQSGVDRYETLKAEAFLKRLRLLWNHIWRSALHTSFMCWRWRWIKDRVQGDEEWTQLAQRSFESLLLKEKRDAAVKSILASYLKQKQTQTRWRLRIWEYQLKDEARAVADATNWLYGQEQHAVAVLENRCEKLCNAVREATSTVNSYKNGIEQMQNGWKKVLRKASLRMVDRTTFHAVNIRVKELLKVWHLRAGVDAVSKEWRQKLAAFEEKMETSLRDYNETAAKSVEETARKTALQQICSVFRNFLKSDQQKCVSSWRHSASKAAVETKWRELQTCFEDEMHNLCTEKYVSNLEIERETAAVKMIHSERAAGIKHLRSTLYHVLILNVRNIFSQWWTNSLKTISESKMETEVQERVRSQAVKITAENDLILLQQKMVLGLENLKTAHRHMIMASIRQAVTVWSIDAVSERVKEVNDQTWEKKLKACEKKQLEQLDAKIRWRTAAQITQVEVKREAEQQKSGVNRIRGCRWNNIMSEVLRRILLWSRRVRTASVENDLKNEQDRVLNKISHALKHDQLLSRNVAIEATQAYETLIETLNRLRTNLRDEVMKVQELELSLISRADSQNVLQRHLSDLRRNLATVTEEKENIADECDDLKKTIGAYDHRVETLTEEHKSDLEMVSQEWEMKMDAFMKKQDEQLESKLRWRASNVTTQLQNKRNEERHVAGMTRLRNLLWDRIRRGPLRHLLMGWVLNSTKGN